MNIAKDNLMRSFNDMYLLYIKILASFGALVHVAEELIEAKKQRYLRQATDLHPNMKFINNVFIQKIEQNTFLQKHINENNLGWNYTDLLFAKKICNAINNESFFIEYMHSNESSFEEDKGLVLSILEKFMLENEDMIFYFGEIKLSWLHDYNDVIIFVHNTLKSFTQEQNDDKSLPTLFKTSKDNNSSELFFAQNLLSKTIQNNNDYEQIVSEKLQNWDLNRLAYIDFILVKMAICEFCEFPTIPLRVTFNEYIEISKYYSTPKSQRFINGLLDNILEHLREKNKINKQGRGLLG